MSGPLDGIVVVDATWGMPGAIGTSLLADYGARVVKVERSECDGVGESLPQHRSVWDRNKSSVVLDPRTPEDAATLRDLACAADVFLESFGPGRAEEYGLAHHQLAERAPGLIVGSLTGYGSAGPWRDRPGYDVLVAARLGLVHEVRGHRPGPVFLGNPAIAYGTGFLLAIDALAALRARRLTGSGQSFEVSLLDGALVQTPMTWWWSERGLSFVSRNDGATTGFGRSRIITDIFECADGRHVMVHSGGEGGFKRTMDLLGFGDDVRDILDRPEMSVPLDDREFEIARILAPGVFATRPCDEWVRLFRDADLAVMEVLRPGEVLNDSQVEHAGMTVEIEDPVLGPVIQTRPPIVFDRGHGATPVQAPRRGEHQSGLLDARSAWVSPGADAQPVALGRGPLEGVRVLDLSSFFATAYGAKLLADLGADVIKVEPPAGDQLRPFPDPFEACNRGKRSLAIDLRDEAGLAVFLDLVATSDVVMHNLRPGKAERLGVGSEQLRLVNPDLIYCYLPGFGSSGPRKDQKSFEPLLSGFTGVLHEAAGPENPPISKSFGNADYFNGLLGCTAALMALEHRARTGRAQYLESPHLHSSLFVVSHNILDSQRRPIRPDLEVDPGMNGWDATYRLFETADGWCAVAAVGERAFRRLCTAIAREDLTCDERFSTVSDRRRNRAALESELEPTFAALPLDEVLDRLEAAAVPAERVPERCTVPDLFFEPWAVDLGRVVEHVHPDHGLIREIGLVTHLSGTPAHVRGPNETLGRHTREVLLELGRTGDEVTRLVAAGVCVDAGG